MKTYLPDKDPAAIEPYFVVWCDKDGTNTGAATDEGELQGATIATSTWSVATGITKVSDNTSAVTVAGVTYAANTVATIWLSGGTDGASYVLTNTITTSETPARTLRKTVIVPVRSGL